MPRPPGRHRSRPGGDFAHPASQPVGTPLRSLRMPKRPRKCAGSSPPLHERTPVREFRRCRGPVWSPRPRARAPDPIGCPGSRAPASKPGRWTSFHHPRASEGGVPPGKADEWTNSRHVPPAEADAPAEKARRWTNFHHAPASGPGIPAGKAGGWTNFHQTPASEGGVPPGKARSRSRAARLRGNPGPGPQPPDRGGRPWFRQRQARTRPPRQVPPGAAGVRQSRSRQKRPFVGGRPGIAANLSTD